MSLSPANRWIRFLRNYGPIPTNDNMYDETIQRALRRHRIEPLVLPTQCLDSVLANFRSDIPSSEILTGTVGDGKTYHCRETWLALGRSENDWNTGRKVQQLPLGTRELIVVKDLSELRADESASLLYTMAADVAAPNPERVYLIAANHGQLLEKAQVRAADARAQGHDGGGGGSPFWPSVASALWVERHRRSLRRGILCVSPHPSSRRAASGTYEPVQSRGRGMETSEAIDGLERRGGPLWPAGSGTMMAAVGRRSI
jgi:hypothetical protein